MDVQSNAWLDRNIIADMLIFTLVEYAFAILMKNKVVLPQRQNKTASAPF